MAVNTSEITSASDDGNISINPNGSGKVIVQDLTGGGERQVGVDNSGAIKPFDAENLAVLPSATQDADVVVVQRGDVKYQASANLFGGGGGGVTPLDDIVWSPRQEGPNASPRFTDCSGKYGIVSGNWTLESKVLECTGDGLFSVASGEYSTGPTAIDVGDSISIIFDEAKVNEAADGDVIYATLRSTDGGYTKNYEMAVKRTDPNFSVPAIAEAAPSAVAVSANGVPSISAPTTIRIGTQGANPLTSPQVSINGGAYQALTSENLTLFPCDSLQFQGTTGGTADETYTLVFEIGGLAATWSVTVVQGATGAVLQPSIISPANQASGVGDRTDGLDLIGSSYTAVNGAGTHLNSDWETYEYDGTGASRAIVTDPTSSVVGEQLTFTGNKDLAYFDPGDSISQTFSPLTDPIVTVIPGQGAAPIADDQGWTTVTYGSSGFVALAPGAGSGNVGTGLVARSSDGVEWIEGSMGEDLYFSSIAFGNGRYAAVNGGPAVSGRGLVYYSDNGVSWNAVNQLTTYGNWTGIATDGASNWVAVSNGGSFRANYSINNAQNWSASSDSGANQGNWTDVAYGSSIGGLGGGVFMAVARGGTARVMYLNQENMNGSWVARPTDLDANAWQGVCYGNGYFVAVASDGTNRIAYTNEINRWTHVAAPEQNTWESIAFGNNRFVAVSSDGTNRIMYSTNAINWTLVAAPEQNSWRDVSFGNGVFVAVSSDGTNRVMYSADGVTWTNSVGGVSGLTFTGDKDLATLAPLDTLIQNALPLTSTNAITNVDTETVSGGWATRGVGGNVYNLSCIAYGDGNWVGLPSTGAADGIFSGDQGQTWSNINNLNSSFTDIVYGGGRWVAVANQNSAGGGRIWYNTGNGLSGWQNAGYTNTDYALNAVAYNGTAYVTVATNGYIFRSTDGSYFPQVASPTSSDLIAIIVGPENDFIALTSFGLFIRSTDDGQSWTTGAQLRGDVNWGSLAYGDGKYVAISTNGTARAPLAYSDDGVTWDDTSYSMPLDGGTWKSVVYGEGKFVAVRNGGVSSNGAASSIDGKSWITSYTGANDAPHWDVAYGGGNFVTVRNYNSGQGESSVSISATGQDTYARYVLDIVGANTDGFEVGMAITSTPSGGTGTISEVSSTQVKLDQGGAGWVIGQTLIGPAAEATGLISSIDVGSNTVNFSTYTGTWVVGATAYTAQKTVTGNVASINVGALQMTATNSSGGWAVGAPITGPVKAVFPPAPSSDTPGSDYRLVNRDLASSDLESHNLGVYPDNTNPVQTTNTITAVTVLGSGNPWTSVQPAYLNATQDAVAYSENDPNGIKWLSVGQSADVNGTDNEDGTNFSFRGGGAAANQDLYGVATDGNGMWVNCGDYGQVNYSTNPKDGWTGQFLAGNIGSVNKAHDIAFGNGVFCIATDFSGANNIYRSVDGINWQLINTPFNQSNGMLSIDTDKNGTWMCVGQGGEIGISTDNGQSWSLSPFLMNGGNGSGYAVGYGNGVWMAFNIDGSTTNLYRSTDVGQSWTNITYPFPGKRVWDFGYANGLWIGTCDSGRIITSTDDGQTWSSLPDPGFSTSRHWRGIAAGEEVWLMVGDDGQMATAPAGSTRFDVLGAVDDGFSVGDVIDDCGNDAEPATIASLDNTQITVPGVPSGWQVGDYICKPGGLKANTTYFSHVKYRSNDPIDSLWSNWSGFEVGVLLPNAGDEFGGGYFVGQYYDGGILYNLIICPRETAGGPSGVMRGETTGPWNPSINSSKVLSGTNEIWGGQWCADFINAGFNTNVTDYLTAPYGPNAGVFDITGASNGTGVGGFNDWYVPAMYELGLAYWMLKPTTDLNGVASTSSQGWNGTVPHANPPINSAPTATVPSQTSNTLFQYPGTADASREYLYSDTVDANYGFGTATWNTTASPGSYLNQQMKPTSGEMVPTFQGNTLAYRFFRRFPA